MKGRRRGDARPRVCFVIPTYNEAPNVTPLLRRLDALYAGEDAAFLIVDDGSPDGTGALVRAFAATHPRVHLLEGRRRGLGDAYARGFAHALDTLGAGVVVQMDADLSHDPADAGKLLARLAHGADVAIGSRYVPGGSIDAGWSPRRRRLSRWGNRLARRTAGLRGVRDCTAGFRAIRAETLRAADPARIRVKGHAFQIALLHRLVHAGARIVEEGIHFRERERGRTKLGAADLAAFLCQVLWLRIAGRGTFPKFALTGLLGVFVNLGSFQLLLELGVHKLLASPIAIELSILSNFLVNNYWTFGDRVMIGRKRIRGLKYHLASLGSLAVGGGTFAALSMLLPEAPPVLLQGCSIPPAMLLNFFLNSSWTFRDAGSGGG